MFKKFLKKFQKKHEKSPEINLNILYLILKSVLENNYDYQFRIGSRKFIRSEIYKTKIDLIFSDGGNEHILSLTKNLTNVYKGVWEVQAIWIDEANYINLTNDHEKIYDRILENCLETI